MRRERHTIFLCWLLLHRQLSTQPTRGARSAQIPLASPSSESRLSRSEAGTQLTSFSQLSAHASGAWRHSHPLVLFPIWDFYFDISEWHIFSARVGTPALMLHPTNPCAKRKVLSLTKPKGKISKTKSLRNYITLLNPPWWGLVCCMLWPWCNCYRRWIWTRRHEFKSWTWLVAFHIELIPLGKVWIQLFSLQLWVNSRAD